MFKQLILSSLLVLRVPSEALLHQQQQQQPLNENNDSTQKKPKSVDLIHELKTAQIIPDVLDIFDVKIRLAITWSSTNVSAEIGNEVEVAAVKDTPFIEVLLPRGNDDEGLKEGMRVVVALTDPDAPSREDPEWSQICHWVVGGVGVKSAESESESETESEYELEGESEGGSEGEEMVFDDSESASASLLFSSDDYKDDQDDKEKSSHQDSNEKKKKYHHHKDEDNNNKKKKEHKKNKHNLDTIIPYKPPGPPPKTGKHRYVFVAMMPANGSTEKLHLSVPKDRRHWGYGDEEERLGVREWAGENGLIVIGANFIYAQNEEQ